MGAEARRGRVVETRGRRVLVRDDAGERVCFLAGKRAVVGDRVTWVPVRGEGGKLVGVSPRETVLRRVDLRGRQQVLAANLEGVLVVAAVQRPPFRAGLLDRYIVAARAGGLSVAVCLNKIDLGVPDEVERLVGLRQATGLAVLQVSATTGDGVDALATWLARCTGPWALVGHSGVGKTSLIAALLPAEDVGPVADLSARWGTGQHTTTGSRIFALPQGGEVVDSPGIRTFAPGGLGVVEARDRFPAIGDLQCRYRDCLHRPDEDGCEADAHTAPELLASWRRLLAELQSLEAKRR